MKYNSRFDLINAERCFDIHRESYDDIKNEMKIFFNEVLCEFKSSGQDSYPYTYLFRHSYDVLEQILDEYFKYHDRQVESKK